MNNIVWISRDWTGRYRIWTKKPRMTKTGLWFGANPLFMILGNLKSVEEKSLLGLKYYIKKQTCIKATLTISTVLER